MITEPTALRLYSPGQMAFATALGSPSAGLVLLAMNYRRLGSSRGFWLSLLFSLAAAVALIVFSIAVPLRGPKYFIPLLYTFLVYHLAKALQGEAISSHMKHGLKSSSWSAAGIGLACFLAILLLFLGTALILPDSWFPDDEVA